MQTTFYSPEEIAEIFGVSQGTVREWLRTGKLKGLKLGKVWRVEEEALTAFVQAAKQAAEEEAARDEQ